MSAAGTPAEAREAALRAALARQAAAANPDMPLPAPSPPKAKPRSTAPVRGADAVRSAASEFNQHLNGIVDKLHNSSEAMLQAVQLLQRLVADLIKYDCKSPKDAQLPVRSALLF